MSQYFSWMEIMKKKVVAIIGGSRGIGLKLVEELKSDFLVSTCSRSALEFKTDTFLICYCNVKNWNSVKGFITKTVEKFGKIDILIYNVGLMIFSDLLNTKEHDFDSMYIASAKGFMFACQEVLPIMKKQKSGHIIYISSTRGITTAAGKAGYSAMKQAGKSLVDSVILENKKYGIRASSICPGTVDTESARERYSMDELSKLNPIEEADVVKAVLFLLSLSKNAQVDSIVIGGQL